MRVAMVSEHASPLAALGGVDAGGQNVHVATLASTLASRGAEVLVHTRRDDPSLPRRVPLCPGVTVDHVDAGPARSVPKDELVPFMDQFAEQLHRAWRRQRPDVVHAHFWMSGKAAVAAAAPLGIPVVHTFHALGVVKRRYQGDRDTSPAERIAVERTLLHSLDRVIATCSDEVFELARMGADPQRVTVVPSGVDLQMFTPDGPAEERTPGLRRLVVISRLVERKGIGNVISALANVPDTELVIAGGPEAAKLETDPEVRRFMSLARAGGVADRVVLRGQVGRADIPALLRSADAVVCVPWYEPFGIVPLEAMACGVPPVVSAVGGLVDTVVDGVTGLHVPPRHPEDLAITLRRLLDDASLRQRLGAAGVQRARSRYGWDRIGRLTYDVYKEISESRGLVASANSFGASFDAHPSRGDPAPLLTGRAHLRALAGPLASLEYDVDRLDDWGRTLADVFANGGRLLVAGNGGSAAQAQHVTSELVGRYRDDRPAFSALALHAESSSLTAIVNDYGPADGFARQVEAHGRPGDVLLALSTSGKSANVLRAVAAARKRRMTTWALTGPAPNPLATECDDAVVVAARATATVQEVHQIAVHLLCAAVDVAVGASRPVAEDTAAESTTFPPGVGDYPPVAVVRPAPDTLRSVEEARS